VTNPDLARPTAAEPDSGLIGRFRHLLHEMGKFGIVGGIAFFVDLATFNVLLAVTSWPVATVGSTVIAATLAFIGNRYWTWRDREKSGLAREYGLYFLFNMVGVLIALAVMWVNQDVLGAIWPEVFHTVYAQNVAKMIVGTGLGTLFRFWAYRRFVFVQATGAPAPIADSPLLEGVETRR
jgi:putative flippase GtrA